VGSQAVPLAAGRGRHREDQRRRRAEPQLHPGDRHSAGVMAAQCCVFSAKVLAGGSVFKVKDKH